MAKSRRVMKFEKVVFASWKMRRLCFRLNRIKPDCCLSPSVSACLLSPRSLSARKEPRLVWRSVRRTVSPSNQVVFILISVSKAAIKEYEREGGEIFVFLFNFYLFSCNPIINTCHIVSRYLSNGFV